MTRSGTLVKTPRGTVRGATTAMLVMLAIGPAVAAAGDVEAGKALSATCAACHGEDGLAVQQIYPILAGQHESYLVHSLRAYRSGARQNAIMAGFATQLSDADIEDLAAFYASLPSPLRTARED